MGTWEGLREWVACLIWPEQGKRVEQLAARLSTVHKRMQEMYWDGQAKEMAKARIAGLEDALWRSCVALYVCGEPDAARRFCEESGIHWDPQEAEKWRKPQAPAPAAALSEGQAPEPPVVLPTGSTLPPECCIFAGVDSAGWCRTHHRQCLTPEEFMARVGPGVAR